MHLASPLLGDAVMAETWADANANLVGFIAAGAIVVAKHELVAVNRQPLRDGVALLAANPLPAPRVLHRGPAVPDGILKALAVLHEPRDAFDDRLQLVGQLALPRVFFVVRLQ